MAPAPAVLTRRLDPREALLWWGRPQRGIVFQRSDWFVIPFSLLWCLFVVGGLRSGYSTDWPVFGAVVTVLVGVVFGGVGLYMLAGRFVVDAWRRGRTVYAVTPTRILIVTPTSIRSVALGLLAEIDLDESWDDSGTITFGPPARLLHAEETMTTDWIGTPLVPTFEQIPAAGQVYALIRQAQSDLGPSDRGPSDRGPSDLARSG